MKMKTQKLNKVLPAIMLAVVILTASDAFAQRGRGYYGKGAGRALDEMPDRTTQKQGFCSNLPGVTQEQLEKIDALHVENLKENQQLRNQLNEKRARLRTLSTADQPDSKAIDATIDEMAALRATIQKNNMAKTQEIRKLLTDEQRVMFDARGPGKKGRGMMGAAGQGRKGPGFRGDCPYRN
jgi:Spy/CpxP family protein refolding chaperone